MLNEKLKTTFKMSYSSILYKIIPIIVFTIIIFVIFKKEKLL